MSSDGFSSHSQTQRYHDDNKAEAQHHHRIHHSILAWSLKWAKSETFWSDTNCYWYNINTANSYTTIHSCCNWMERINWRARWRERKDESNNSCYWSHMQKVMYTQYHFLELVLIQSKNGISNKSNLPFWVITIRTMSSESNHKCIIACGNTANHRLLVHNKYWQFSCKRFSQNLQVSHLKH